MKMSKMACLGALILMPFLGFSQESGIDLWDTWRLGFEKYEAAEKAFKQKNLDDAAKLYRESQTIFQKIKKASPGWNAEVVAYRISLCTRKINEIDAPRRRAVTESQRKHEISKLTKDIEQLKKQLRQTRIELIDARSAADRNALSEKQVKKLMQENSALEKTIAAREATISSLKADLVKADKSEQYQKQLLKAKTDIEKSRQEVARLRKDLETMRNRSQKFQDQRNQAESKVFRLEEQLKELNARKKEIEVLTGENKKLAEMLNQTARNLREADQKNLAAQKKNTALQDKIDALESGKIQSASEKKLREELANEKKASADMTAAVSKSLQENKKMLAEVEKLRAENRKLVLDLVKSTESVAKLHADYNSLMKTSEEQRRQIITAQVLAAENAKLKKDVDEIAKKYAELRELSKKENSAKINELTLALDNARTNFRFTEERLRRAEASLKGSSSRLQQTIVRLEEEKAVLRQTAVLSKQELGNVKSALEKLTIEYEALKEEFDSLNTTKSSIADKPVDKTPSAPVKVVEKVIVEKKVKDPAAEKEWKDKIAKLSSELNRLKKENAKYRIQFATFEKLEQENKALLASQKNSNDAIAAGNAAKIADLEKIRKLSDKINQLETALTAAQEQNRKKDQKISENSRDLKNSVALLKKQLITAQAAETKVRKELALLKMEYSDLEKKIAGTVSASSLSSVKKLNEKLNSDLAALRAAKAESDASLKSAEELIKLQTKRLEDYAKEINPNAKTQISKLTAAVAELQEAKIQYETLLRQLKGKVETLTEDNKELRLANVSLQAQTAELKVKPAEYQKTIKDLEQRNSNLQTLYKKYNAEAQKLSLKDKDNEKKLQTLNKELLENQALVQRFRKELNEWGDVPQTETGDIVKKNKAIDELVAETADLRKERDVLTTELTISKDNVVKYKRLATDIEANLQITRAVVARLKNALARHTSAVEVEKLIEEQYKVNSGEYGPVASVSEIQKEVKIIEDEEKPKFTAEELTARKKAYEDRMKKGLAAEKNKDYTEALIHYWKATEFNPESAELQKALARVYLIKRDFVNARDHYRDAVQKYNLPRDPAFEEQLLILAQEYFDNREVQKNLSRMKKDTSEKTEAGAEDRKNAAPEKK
ncbi:MAG: hypothetical protein IKB25_11050 [Lentisphaeria bacterium]|nr:hypothetical protein [Lentisphaeria bacterium]